MATIDNRTKWRDAAAHWITVNRQTITGIPGSVPPSDEDFDPLLGVITDGTGANITPSLATLEAALDSANAAVVVKAAQVAVQANAKAQAAAIPSWAEWTEAEALAWHDTNITNALPVANLAAANVVLDRLATENRALIRMVIALRNQVWSDLQE